MKTCNKDGCSNPVFGGGYCKFHQYLRSKPPKKIRKYSPKRQSQVSSYLHDRKLFLDELRDTEEWRCFFCGVAFKFNDNPDVHHLRGRDDDLITNTKYWVVAHTNCHVEMWHGKALSILENIWWFDSFKKRLCSKDYITYKRYFDL